MVSSSGRSELILSGGGSRGAVELGFYRALREAGIRVAGIVGVSVGAINAAFIASGVPVEEMWNLWKSTSFQKLFKINWRFLWNWDTTDALYDNSLLRKFLEANLPVQRFEDLSIPLRILGTDLQSGQGVILENGNLIDAIMGSTALPGLFPPAIIEGHQIVDGGLTDNLPLDLVSPETERIFAMVCQCRKMKASSFRGIVKILSRSFEISVSPRFFKSALVARGHRKIIILEPCISEEIGFLDFSHGDQLLEFGYQFALQELELSLGETSKNSEMYVSQ
ncbi:patatin-like phospholipase family protein [bacterium]|nr:patatin-like phospholipase family protein [bacterium]